MVAVLAEVGGLRLKEKINPAYEHIDYCMPLLFGLARGDYSLFEAIVELRRPLVPLVCSVDVYFQSSVIPRVPLMIGNSMIYGAMKLIAPRSTKREECLSAVLRHLSCNQLKAIESGRMFAAAGVSDWGQHCAITVAVMADTGNRA